MNPQHAAIARYSNPFQWVTLCQPFHSQAGNEPTQPGRNWDTGHGPETEKGTNLCYIHLQMPITCRDISSCPIVLRLCSIFPVSDQRIPMVVPGLY